MHHNKKFILAYVTFFIAVIFLSVYILLGYKDSLFINSIEDYSWSTGKNYIIKNLKDCKYEIEIKAKEYEYGEFIKDHNLLTTILVNNDSNFKFGISYDDNWNKNCISLLINNSYYSSDNLDFLKNSKDGLFLSSISKIKKFKLEESLPVAIYSIGGKNNLTESVNIDKNFTISKNNKNDFVIYLKLTKII